MNSRTPRLRRHALSALALLPLAAPASAHSWFIQTSEFQDRAKLKDTINTLVYAHVDIDEMTATADGDWLIVADGQLHYSEGFSGAAVFGAALYMLGGAEICAVAVHEDGGAVVVTEDDFFIQGDFPYRDLLEEKLTECMDAGLVVRELAFDSDGTGWTLAASGGYCWSVSIPSGLMDVIRDRHASGRTIEQVSISPDGRWCVIADDWYATDDVSTDLRTWLSDFQRDGRSLDRIMLGLGGNAVLYCHGYESPDLSLGIEALEHKLGDDDATSLFQRMVDLDVPGVGLAVVEDGELVWARGYGELSAGDQTPCLASTPFDCASVSKGVGTMAILSVVDEAPNGLNLDTNLFDAVVDNGVWNTLGFWAIFSSSVKSNLAQLPVTMITLRRLLSHTAGFVPHGSTSYKTSQSVPGTSTLHSLFGMKVSSSGAVSFGNSNHAWYEPQIKLGEGDTTVYLPGEKYDYSGGGMQLAAGYAETYTGQPFRDIAQERVLDRLGMEDSTFEQPLASGFLARAAKPHSGGVALDPEDVPYYIWSVAGGLYSSPEDLSKYICTLIDLGTSPDGEQVLQPGTAQAMITDQVAGSDGYGLGMDVTGNTTPAGSGWFFHGGTHDQARAWVYGSAGRREGLVILMNAGGDDAAQLRTELRNTFKSHYGWQ